MADPGFSQGAPTPRGAPGYNFIKFSRKLHEIEKNLVAGGGGGARAGGAPPRSATENALTSMEYLKDRIKSIFIKKMAEQISTKKL